MARPWNHNLAYHPWVLARLPSPCPTALDVGCGDGVLARRLAPVAGRVTGVDASAEMVDLARERSDGVPNVDYVAGDVLAADLPGGYDAVCCVATLHHMELRAGLRRLAELVRPGGVLLVVGLARAGTAGDYAFGAAGVVATRLLRWRRGWWEPGAPLVDPAETYGEVRAAVVELLPGARFRRRLLFRYTVEWRKPG